MTAPTKFEPGKCAICGATNLPGADRAQPHINHFTDATRTLCNDCKRKNAAVVHANKYGAHRPRKRRTPTHDQHQ